MRVIAGYLKGRRLKSPDGIRPVTDLIKEAIFNILQNEDWQNIKVLDLFAGSGSLGIESLSRGARQVLFIDKNPVSKAIIKENLKNTEFNYEILTGDVFILLKKLFKKGSKFNIIFSDPPFDLFLGDRILKEIACCELLEEKGLLVLRLRDKEKIHIPGIFDSHVRVYGDSVVYFLRKL